MNSVVYLLNNYNNLLMNVLQLIFAATYYYKLIKYTYVNNKEV